MEESGGGEGSFSPSWRRDALRRLRRLRRRISSDPLLSRLSPGDGSPTSRRPVVVVRGTVPKGKPARVRRGEVRPGETGGAGRDGTGRYLRRSPSRARQERDMFSHFSFWKRIVGIVIAVAVILLLMWITLNPPQLLQLEPCPDDWLYYKKKCYYHSGSRSPADWNSSQEACSKYGASLAVIDNHQELNFIMYRIRITDFWIGLRRKGNKFFWVNGESFDTNLFHVNLTNNGDCVHIDSAFISTRRCSSHRNWLCTIGQFNPKTSS
ncbi:C-type lectin domain family 2 member B-like [Alca torda]